VFFFLVLFYSTAYCQQSKKPPKEPVPDGTEGEMFQNKDRDSSTGIKNLPYPGLMKFDGLFTTLKFGVSYLGDFVAYSQDQISKQQITTPGSNFATRDARFSMSGQLKTKREITWRIGINYDGDIARWNVRESGVQVKYPELNGYFFVGRTKEGYSMQKVMNGFSLWGFERPMIQDVIPILNDGIKYLGYFPKARLIVNAGMYVGWLSSNGEQAFGTYDYTFVTRVIWLPVYSSPFKPVLHIGINYSYGKPANDSLQIRSRPEVGSGPYFIDTKKMWVNYTNSISGEIYFRAGSFLIGSEFSAHMVNSPAKGNPVMTGGSATVLYSLTKDLRPYNPELGIFGFKTTKKSVFSRRPRFY